MNDTQAAVLRKSLRLAKKDRQWLQEHADDEALCLCYRLRIAVENWNAQDTSKRYWSLSEWMEFAGVFARLEVLFKRRLTNECD
jgi:hypothetical protein